MAIDLDAVKKSVEGNHPSSYELVRTSALSALVEAAEMLKEIDDWVDLGDWPTELVEKFSKTYNRFDYKGKR